jgi:hypothetical protein
MDGAIFFMKGPFMISGNNEQGIFFAAPAVSALRPSRVRARQAGNDDFRTPSAGLCQPPDGDRITYQILC